MRKLQVSNPLSPKPRLRRQTTASDSASSTETTRYLPPPPLTFEAASSSKQVLRCPCEDCYKRRVVCLCVSCQKWRDSDPGKAQQTLRSPSVLPLPTSKLPEQAAVLFPRLEECQVPVQAVPAQQLALRPRRERQQLPPRAQAIVESGPEKPKPASKRSRSGTDKSNWKPDKRSIDPSKCTDANGEALPTGCEGYKKYISERNSGGARGKAKHGTGCGNPGPEAKRSKKGAAVAS